MLPVLLAMPFTTASRTRHEKPSELLDRTRPFRHARSAVCPAAEETHPV